MRGRGGRERLGPHRHFGRHLLTRVPLPRGTGATAAGDSNGDGTLDLVSAGGSDSLSVLLNDGTGCFLRQFEFATSQDPQAVVLADLDGDGDLDVFTVGTSARRREMRNVTYPFMLARDRHQHHWHYSYWVT